jgi:Putative bacterial sensory transduction regulator
MADTNGTNNPSFPIGRDAAGGARRVGVQPFERSMIKDHLERQNLKYLVDQDGDFRVDFAAFSDDGYELTVWMTAEGTNEDIFVIRTIANARIPKTLWLDVMQACNQWNMEKRYPKAFLFLPNDPEELFGSIHLEGQFPLAAGVTQPVLDEFINTIIGTSFSFWEWIVSSRLLVESLGGND